MAFASPSLGSVVTCAETGKQFTIARDGCSLNYASDRAGAIYSDEGANIRERRELLDRSRPFCCYLSCDGRRVTGWKENTLGTVIRESVSRTGWHRSTITHVRVVDVHGGRWHGKGAGPGMFIRLHPCK